MFAAIGAAMVGDVKHSLLGRPRRVDDGRIGVTRLVDCDVDCEFIGESIEREVVAEIMVPGHAPEESLEGHLMKVLARHCEGADVIAATRSLGGTSVAIGGNKPFEVVGMTSHVSDELGSDCLLVGDIAVELIRQCAELAVS